MTWISVLDSLPKNLETVLLFDEAVGLSIGYRFKHNCFIRYLDGLKLDKVSHWMSVPEAPALCLEDELQVKELKKLIADC
jgi:hypothetical protein